MLEQIELTARGQSLTTKSVFVASNLVNEIKCSFDTDWDVDEIRAVFSNDARGKRISVVLENNECLVPHEVLEDKGLVSVNLVGSVLQGEELLERMTSYKTYIIEVKQKVYVEGANTATPTPSEFEQFVEIVKEDADRAETARDEAEAYAESASESANSAETFMESAQASSEFASQSAESAAQSAQSAHTSEVNAAASEVNAKASEDAAKESEDNAKASEELAEGYKDAAHTSEVNAEASKQSALSSSIAAHNSEVSAENSAEDAAESETSAASSAQGASESATAAASSATDASSSASQASASATAASESATVAAGSATQAATSATAAQTARTGSETAQTAAETAQAAAEDARDDAIAAKEEAEEIIGEVVRYDEEEISGTDIPINADQLNGHQDTYFAKRSDLTGLEEEVELNTDARHEHGNKSVLDVITQAMITAIGTIADKYVKPSGGIPKSDLAGTVKESLNKADTALQSYNITYTIEEVL